MRKLLSRLAYALNDLLPGAKRLVPKSAARFLLLNVVGVQKSYPDVSRKVLEQEILPDIAKRYARVLFVGTGSYTYWYERLFRRGQFTTIESNPAHAVWGSDDNIVAPVQELGRHRPTGSFDCVVLNGIFGFGVKEPDEMRLVAAVLHDALQPNGYLVLGWNDDMQEDPDKLGTFDGLFRHCAPRRTFAGETHVYDFYLRQ